MSRKYQESRSLFPSPNNYLIGLPIIPLVLSCCFGALAPSCPGQGCAWMVSVLINEAALLPNPLLPLSLHLFKSFFFFFVQTLLSLLFPSSVALTLSGARAGSAQPWAFCS